IPQSLNATASLNRFVLRLPLLAPHLLFHQVSRLLIIRLSDDTGITALLTPISSTSGSLICKNNSEFSLTHKSGSYDSKQNLATSLPLLSQFGWLMYSPKLANRCLCVSGSDGIRTRALTPNPLGEIQAEYMYGFSLNSSRHFNAPCGVSNLSRSITIKPECLINPDAFLYLNEPLKQTPANATFSSSPLSLGNCRICSTISLDFPVLILSSATDTSRLKAVDVSFFDLNIDTFIFSISTNIQFWFCNCK